MSRDSRHSEVGRYFENLCEGCYNEYAKICRKTKTKYDNAYREYLEWGGNKVPIPAREVYPMRLIDADQFEVYIGKVPPEYDSNSYLAGNMEVLEAIDAAPTMDPGIRNGVLNAVIALLNRAKDAVMQSATYHSEYKRGYEAGISEATKSIKELMEKNAKLTSARTIKRPRREPKEE